ncbi:hypothetical protein LFWB_0240 [Candidatus Phytoplasma luffae]|uniref:Uncharacterized protein n=2 Tax=Loofah witches'-broom phytoplasma TaxID=35773 RepID=A0A975FIQ8_LOWBP|nr:hypothetical protein LFWB_0240 [Candidatus Phytoplasma luffae]
MIPSRMSSYPPDKSSSFRFLKNPSNNTSSPYSVYYDISEEFKGTKIRQNKHLVGQNEVFQNFRHFLFFKISLRLTIKLVFFYSLRIKLIFISFLKTFLERD